MKHMKATLLLWALFFATPFLAQLFAQSPTVPVTITVTVNARKGNEVAKPAASDFLVYANKQRIRVVKVQPVVRRSIAIIVDDTLPTEAGNLIEDVRKFVRQLPSNTDVMVAYASDGTVKVTQPFTSDLHKAAEGIRITTGNGYPLSSIYDSVEEFIKGWSSAAGAPEVIVVSDGIDRRTGRGMFLPDLDPVIHAAQKKGVLVYTFFTGLSGHMSRNFFRVANGQGALSQLADSTGADSFPEAAMAPVNFTPYLEHLSRDLANQYSVTVRVPVGNNKDGFVPLHVTTELPNTEMSAQNAVYVEQRIK